MKQFLKHAPLICLTLALVGVMYAYQYVHAFNQQTTVYIHMNAQGTWTLKVYDAEVSTDNLIGTYSGVGPGSATVSRYVGTDSEGNDISEGRTLVLTADSVSGYTGPVITNTENNTNTAYIGNDTGGDDITYTAAYTANSTQPVATSTPQAVDLTLSGVPAGVDYTIANRTCTPTCQSTINFTIHNSAAAGTYPITVTGTPDNKTTTFNLVVQNSPDLLVSCMGRGTSAGTGLVGQPVTWTGTASGGVPPYTYLWSGTNIPSPGPTTLSFTTTYSSVGVKMATLTVTDSLGNVGRCDPAGTVQVNFNPQFKEI